jgi:hypothetical protein
MANWAAAVLAAAGPLPGRPGPGTLTGKPRLLSSNVSCNGNPLVDGRLTVRRMRRVDWTC